jgi:hypothetical protein
VAGAGIDANLPGDCLIHALRSAIADRHGSIDGPLVGDACFAVELLSPVQTTLEGRIEELELARALLFLMAGAAKSASGPLSTNAVFGLGDRIQQAAASILDRAPGGLRAPRARSAEGTNARPVALNGGSRFASVTALRSN